MSPARETSALTFGAAAALVAGALGWFVLGSSGLWAFVPMVAVGAVALVLGAAAGERVAASGWLGASGLGAAALVATEGAVLLVLLVIESVGTVSRGGTLPPRVLSDPYAWLAAAAGAVVMALIGGAAGIVARSWARSAEAA